MSDLAIRAEHLGKRYRIGQRFGIGNRYQTLRDAVMYAAARPFRRLRGSGESRARSEEARHIWALRDVSFEVKEGEVVGIIGRNGAGKSTLLKILSRITEPTRGQAEIHGRVGALLEVGTGFHLELTGRENVFLNGAILGMRRREIERKYDEIVEFSEVSKFMDTPVKYYSSGMYVRLAFAVAAHLEPEVLLIDEVLAVGDVGFQRKCLGKMSDVAREGRTVVFVSHNMGAISNLCQRAMLLDGGRIVDSGSVESVVASYVLLATAAVGGGYSDLRERSREGAVSKKGRYRSPLTAQASFDWVRTLNEDGEEAGTFLEGEPVTVEVGLTVRESAEHLQVACGVGATDVHGDLFTLSSPEWPGPVRPGQYVTRVRLDPNYLREGTYLLGLRMFADGARRDTQRDAIGISIVGRLAADDPSSLSQRWVQGRFRFDYQWDPLAAGNGEGRRRSVPASPAPAALWPAPSSPPSPTALLHGSGPESERES
jgi:ABC-type polysaccharide/polyol phosphate transport system ATPase subunit